MSTTLIGFRCNRTRANCLVGILARRARCVCGYPWVFFVWGSFAWVRRSRCWSFLGAGVGLCLACFRGDPLVGLIRFPLVPCVPFGGAFRRLRHVFVSCGLVWVLLMFGSRLRARARGNRKVVTAPGKVDVTVRAFGYRIATENSHFNDAKQSKWE